MRIDAPTHRTRSIMKTQEQIAARIAELESKLAQARNEAMRAKEVTELRVADARIHRLEGNIGALEWVLRMELAA